MTGAIVNDSTRVGDHGDLVVADAIAADRSL
jgi:hypothetical protein